MRYARPESPTDQMLLLERLHGREGADRVRAEESAEMARLEADLETLKADIAAGGGDPEALRLRFEIIKMDMELAQAAPWTAGGRA